MIPWNKLLDCRGLMYAVLYMYKTIDIEVFAADSQNQYPEEESQYMYVLSFSLRMGRTFSLCVKVVSPADHCMCALCTF